MLFTASFLCVAKAFVAASGIEPRTLSSRIFNDGKVLPAVLAGARTISLKRADAALLWFSDHWPEGADWPPLVPRPLVPSALPSDAEPSP